VVGGGAVLVVVVLGGVVVVVDDGGTVVDVDVVDVVVVDAGAFAAQFTVSELKAELLLVSALGQVTSTLTPALSW
jgi:hypothetical protein